MFAGQVKIASQSSCRTSAILKYFGPLVSFSLPYAGFDLLLGSHNLGFLDVWLVLGSIIAGISQLQGFLEVYLMLGSTYCWDLTTWAS